MSNVEYWIVTIDTLRWKKTWHEQTWKETTILYDAYAEDGDLISIKIERQKMEWEGI